jgi:hypothetical protein
MLLSVRYELYTSAMLFEYSVMTSQIVLVSDIKFRVLGYCNFFFNFPIGTIKNSTEFLIIANTLITK